MQSLKTIVHGFSKYRFKHNPATLSWRLGGRPPRHSPPSSQAAAAAGECPGGGGGLRLSRSRLSLPPRPSFLPPFAHLPRPSNLGAMAPPPAPDAAPSSPNPGSAGPDLAVSPASPTSGRPFPALARCPWGRGPSARLVGRWCWRRRRRSPGVVLAGPLSAWYSAAARWLGPEAASPSRLVLPWPAASW